MSQRIKTFFGLGTTSKHIFTITNITVTVISRTYSGLNFNSPGSPNDFKRPQHLFVLAVCFNVYLFWVQASWPPWRGHCSHTYIEDTRLTVPLADFIALKNICCNFVSSSTHGTDRITESPALTFCASILPMDDVE